jgi:hypothetical protein
MSTVFFIGRILAGLEHCAATQRLGPGCTKTSPDMLMKGKSGSMRTIKIKSAALDPEAVALTAFDRLVAEPERLERFMAMTGLLPSTIRQAAGEPGFMAAVLDHVSGDEALLLAVAAESGLDPQAIEHARQRLSPEAEFDP